MTAKFDIEATIREYIPQVLHMSLATVTDNKPRVFEIHFAYDDNLNFYFISATTAQHSEAIRNNPNVAGSIATQHFLNQKVRGVYFEGTAKQLTDIEEMKEAYQAYTHRFHDSPQVAQTAKAEGSARFFKISVQDFCLIDGYDTSPPKKLHLLWND